MLTGSCPLLVPIVEEGRGEDDPIVSAVLSDYLRELQRQRPTVLILGCTHYPLLARALGKLMGPHVRLVDSGQATALAVKGYLGEHGLANPRPEVRYDVIRRTTRNVSPRWPSGSLAGRCRGWTGSEPTNWPPPPRPDERCCDENAIGHDW